MQNAVSGSKQQQQNLEDYNPFANQQGVAGGGGGSSQPPVLNTQNVEPIPPPSYTATNQQQISSRDFEVCKLCIAFPIPATQSMVEKSKINRKR